MHSFSQEVPHLYSESCRVVLNRGPDIPGPSGFPGRRVRRGEEEQEEDKEEQEEQNGAWLPAEVQMLPA